MQDVNHVRAADALRVVYTGILETGDIHQLLGAALRQSQHVFLGAEMQAAGRARLDARRLQALSDAVGTQRALEYLFRCGIEFRDVERAAGDAVAAADALFLLEVHDAVGVLHDGPVGGTRDQATRLGAVHALVLAHEPHEIAVFGGVHVELDQVPEIPRRIRHGLVGVVEDGLAVRQAVPFQAGHFAGLAADACCDVNQLADVQVALRAGAGSRARVAGDSLNFKCRFSPGAPYALSTFTRNALNSGVYAFGSITTGVSMLMGVSAVLPASSAMPR